MTRIRHILLMLLVTGYMQAQQVFTNFQNASMVIGQPNFTSAITNSSDSITRGPSYCAISSKGMLAVAEQTGSSVKIWNTMPTRNGQRSDVQISLTFYANGLDWSPDGNKLIVAGGSSSIYIWNSIPTVNNQAADVKINLYADSPQGVLVTPNGKLLIAERYANRILVWNSIPTVDNTPADYVIGQPDMITISSGNTSGKLNEPWGIDISPDGRLLIADESNNRVVVYDSVPETFGDTATVVIGQTNFGISNNGCSDSTQRVTVGVTVTVDGKVAISEYGNSRVTIFDSVPKKNNAKASVVLGQPNFTSSSNFYPSGLPDTNNMYHPYTISSDLNGRLFLVGRDMNRIMVFGELPADSADLNISISAASASLCDSSAVNYLMKIHNLGDDTAKSVVATTALPSGFSLNEFQTACGYYIKSSGYWHIPSIAPHDSALLSITGNVDSSMGGKTIVTYANIINSSAIDTNLNNNGTSLSVAISDSTRPADAITEDVYTCKGTSAELTASGSGTFYWYSNINDVEPLDTGLTFLTQPVYSSKTYYVEVVGNCSSRNRIPLSVLVNPTYYDTIPVSINNGESYELGSQILTESGIYSEIFGTVNSCDSVLTVILTKETINQTVSNTDNTLLFKVYPNPFADELSIDYRGKNENIYVTIFNNSGQQVISSEFTGSQQKVIDVAQLSSGLYLIRIIDGNSTGTIRIIKR
jgi:hypothetical protein